MQTETLKNVRKQATEVAVSSDGSALALGGRRAVYIVKLPDRGSCAAANVTCQLRRQSRFEVSCIQWSPRPERASWLATGSNTSVFLFRADRSPRAGVDIEPEARLSAHQRLVTDVDWSPHDCNVLASASADALVHVWDVRDPRNSLRVGSFPAYTSAATAVSWNSLDRLVLASAHDSGELRIWDARRTAAPLLLITAHTRKITALAWSEANPLLLMSAGLDCKAKLWSMQTPKSPIAHLSAAEPIQRAMLSPYGLGCVTVAGVRGRSTVQLWSWAAHSPPLIHTFPVANSDGVVACDWRVLSGPHGGVQLVTLSKGDDRVDLWALSPEHVAQLADDDDELTTGGGGGGGGGPPTVAVMTGPTSAAPHISLLSTTTTTTTDRSELPVVPGSGSNRDAGGLLLPADLGDPDGYDDEVVAPDQTPFFVGGAVRKQVSARVRGTRALHEGDRQLGVVAAAAEGRTGLIDAAAIAASVANVVSGRAIGETVDASGRRGVPSAGTVVSLDDELGTAHSVSGLSVTVASDPSAIPVGRRSCVLVASALPKRQRRTAQRKLLSKSGSEAARALLVDPDLAKTVPLSQPELVRIGVKCQFPATYPGDPPQIFLLPSESCGIPASRHAHVRLELDGVAQGWASAGRPSVVALGNRLVQLTANLAVDAIGVRVRDPADTHTTDDRGHRGAKSPRSDEWSTDDDGSVPPMPTGAGKPAGPDRRRVKFASLGTDDEKVGSHGSSMSSTQSGPVHQVPAAAAADDDDDDDYMDPSDLLDGDGEQPLIRGFSAASHALASRLVKPQGGSHTDEVTVLPDTAAATASVNAVDAQRIPCPALSGAVFAPDGRVLFFSAFDVPLARQCRTLADFRRRRRSGAHLKKMRAPSLFGLAASADRDSRSPGGLVATEGAPATGGGRRTKRLHKRTGSSERDDSRERGTEDRSRRRLGQSGTHVRDEDEDDHDYDEADDGLGTGSGRRLRRARSRHRRTGSGLPGGATQASDEDLAGNDDDDDDDNDGWPSSGRTSSTADDGDDSGSLEEEGDFFAPPGSVLMPADLTRSFLARKPSGDRSLRAADSSRLMARACDSTVYCAPARARIRRALVVSVALARKYSVQATTGDSRAGLDSGRLRELRGAGDGPRVSRARDACLSNAAAAFSVGARGHARAWRLIASTVTANDAAGLSATDWASAGPSASASTGRAFTPPPPPTGAPNTPPIPAASDGLSRTPWSLHPLGGGLARSLLEYALGSGNSQLATVLSAAFRLADAESAAACAAQPDGGSLTFVPLLDPALDRECDLSRIAYAELLHRLGELERRAEVLNSVTATARSALGRMQRPKSEVPPEMELEVRCSTCATQFVQPSAKGGPTASDVLAPPLLAIGKTAGDSACAECSAARLVTCTVCRLAVRGLASFCQRCGHGGHWSHVHQWYTKHAGKCALPQCPCICKYE